MGLHGVDTVTVWLIRLDLPAAALAGCAAVLDPTERRRAGAVSDPRSRARFVAAHGAVRQILADRLAVPAQRFEWRLGPHGKPALAAPVDDLECNLSHSGELAMFAVSGHRPVGVDIQAPVRSAVAVRLAARYFPEPEAALVAGAGDPAAVFGRLWVRKEACAKAVGGRLLPHLGMPVTGGDASGAAGSAGAGGQAITGREAIGAGAGTDADARPGGLVRPAAAARGPATGDAPPPYRICDLAAPEGWHAALALTGQAPCKVIVRSWQPGALGGGIDDPPGGEARVDMESRGGGEACLGAEDRGGG